MQEKEKLLYEYFKEYTITELQELVYNAKDREEALFYNRILNFKLGLEQEKVLNKELLYHKVCTKSK